MDIDFFIKEYCMKLDLITKIGGVKLIKGDYIFKATAKSLHVALAIYYS